MDYYLFCKEKPVPIFLTVNLFVWLGFIILGIIISPLLIASFASNPRIIWKAVKEVNKE